MYKICCVEQAACVHDETVLLWFLCVDDQEWAVGHCKKRNWTVSEYCSCSPIRTPLFRGVTEICINNL